MACYHPVPAVRLPSGDVTFVSALLADGSAFKLPCGQCIGCRLEKSRQWAIRCLDEGQMHDDNCFITLTFNPESVKLFGRSLDVSHFQKFMKRFRREVAPTRLRFFHCGEYTEAFNPHYHAVIFGYNFPDQKYWSMSKSGKKVFVSDQLSRLWPHGFSYVGGFCFESAAYVARYVLKKVGDVSDPKRLVMSNGEVLSPEYVTMSRRPGIGTSWYRKFKNDVYPHGRRVVRGVDMQPPRFYDKLYEMDDPLGYEELKFLRKDLLDLKDNSMLRLGVKEEVTNARLALYPRE